MLILTRSSAIPYLGEVTVAPITSTIRGIPSEVVLTTEDGMREDCAQLGPHSNRFTGKDWGAHHDIED